MTPVEDVVGLVVNTALTPLGSPLMESVTLLLNPFTGFRLTYTPPLAPCAMVTEDPAERVKPGAATERMIGIDAVTLPLTAFNVAA